VVVIAVGQLGRIPVPALYQSHEHQMYQSAMRLARTQGRSADVLVMGSSRAMYGVDPQEMARDLRLPGLPQGKLKVVNIAAPAATPAANLYLWRGITANSARPPRLRVALVGVAPLDFTAKTPGTDYLLRYLYRTGDVVWLLRQGRMDDAAALLTYRLYPLYTLRRSLVRLLMRQPQPEPPFGPPTRAVDLLWLVRFTGWYRDYRIDPFQVRCLERMVAQMQARGIRVILFSPPMKMSLLRIEAGLEPAAPMFGGRGFRPRPGSPLRQLRAVARRDFGARAGIPYLDYAQPQDARGLGFWDPTHLRPASAIRFSRRFAADVNRVLERGAPPAGERRQEKRPALRY
jgi:hypothetical protein